MTANTLLLWGEKWFTETLSTQSPSHAWQGRSVIVGLLVMNQLFASSKESREITMI